MAETTNRGTGRRVAQPGDMTALRKQVQEEERDEQQREAARKMTMAKEVEEYDKRHTVIDYTGADQPLPEVVEEEDNDDPYREIIIKYDIDQMAFGREIVKDAVMEDDGTMKIPPILGNIRFLSFKEGRRYRVPRALADHLDERGFVFH